MTINNINRSLVVRIDGVSKINNLDFEMLVKILSSTELTGTQKIQFVQNNQSKITTIMDAKISSTDYKNLMEKRKLRKFRPLKNSFTKKADKILLAKALEINLGDVNNYIKTTADSISDIEKINFLDPNKMDMMKTYVYRHGSKKELVAFLDYELSTSTDILKTLYRTLRYHNNGVADYFIRPIHRMDNNTLIKVYHIVDKNIKQSFLDGKITEAQSGEIARWALVQIYKIQNNSKLINAIKTYQALN